MSNSSPGPQVLCIVGLLVLIVIGAESAAMATPGSIEGPAAPAARSPTRALSGVAESSPTRLPTDTPTVVVPTATPSPTPPFAIPTYPSNTQGDILVLVYHGIHTTEGRWARTPDNFRSDLERMLALGYYPVNLIDMATGNLGHVPRGRRPIVLTFDDSSSGQFRYLQDGSVDPQCAVGVLLAMHETYGDYWPLRATFYVLLWDAEEPGTPLFGQPELAAQKVRALVEWGMEIGSHTIGHHNLALLAPAEVQYELAASQHRIQALIPGYRVRSLATPEGSIVRDTSLLTWGHSQSGLYYHYDAVVLLLGRAAHSPFSPDFDPYAIPRVQAIQSELDAWFSRYERHPEEYYVSDGKQPENASRPYESRQHGTATPSP
jgi:peptidoglycan/xylan/chitin deacetylase (PgdA/CDA1 family)